jgi:hypothetical protein
MKTLKTAEVSGKRLILRFSPEHDSPLGHFADEWAIVTSPLPITGRGVRKSHFKTFVSAMTRFNKLTQTAA